MLKNPIKLLLILILLLVVAMISACGNGTEEPEIKIQSGLNKLAPTYHGDSNKDDQEEIEERLKDFMIGKRFSDLPTVHYGETIQFEALNFETEEIEIYDYVLDQKANIISEYVISPLSISSLEEGMSEFTFEASNDFNTYQEYAIDGNLIHCLLIRCEINGNSFAFSTIILGE